MWTVSAHELLILRGAGGERFTDFVDTVIRCHAFAAGLKSSDVVTNSRVNQPDGGVDTEVKSRIENDATGWFSVPTCWQYKATDHTDVRENELCKEINKRYARELVAKGYGYRLCINDAMQSSKKGRWEEILNCEAKRIRTDAAPCRILSNDDLAPWTSKLASVVVRFFRPQLAGVLHFETWGQQVADAIPTYVPVPEWELVQQSIQEHLTFSDDPGEVIFTIAGDAGVGKTRLAYEAIKCLPGASELVIYSDNESVVLNAATWLCNEAQSHAIIVADECSVAGRLQLHKLLQAHRNRVRVVTIDNFAERIAGLTPERAIGHMLLETTEKVLAVNFPTVPSDRRHRYAEVSRGFLAVAAFLARHDTGIVARGTLEPAIPSIHDFLQAHVQNDHLRCVEAIALVQRVGFRDDVQDEFRDLCELACVDPGDTRDLARRVKDATGFVVQAGRYLYVTPDPIAEVAFARAWNRLARDNPDGFLSRIPPRLLASFQNRVSRSAASDVREVVGRFFWRAANLVKPPDLTDQSAVERLAVLVETDPPRYLPLLRRVIDAASLDELLQVRGDYERGWGPRRTLVWLAERLAVFPEYFIDCEAILFRLAIAETEPKIGNNATQIWRQLHRIFLSGTATPFLDRLRLLETRLAEVTGESRDVLLQGLDQTLESYGTRMMGPAVVAGRIAPQDWRPASNDEHRESLRQAVTILERLSHADDAHLRAGALSIAIQRLNVILFAGFFDQAVAIFRGVAHSADVIPQLLQAIDDFVEQAGQQATESELDRIIKWKQSLLPSDIHGRLVSIVGMDPWRHLRNEVKAETQRSIDSLADELVCDRATFQKELQWLCSPAAKSAGAVGYAIGIRDADMSYAGLIFEHSALSDSTGFGRGYVAGLLSRHSSIELRLNALLDEIEATAPLIALDIALVGEEKTRAAERTLQLLAAGRVPPESVHGLLQGGFWKRIPTSLYAELIAQLLAGVHSGNDRAANAVVMFVAFRLNSTKDGEAENILAEPQILENVLDILDLTVEDGGGASHWWHEILKALMVNAPDRAVKLVCRATVAKDYQHRQLAKDCLGEIAGQQSELVMIELGKLMLDERFGWHFSVDRYESIIAEMPINDVKRWLDHSGVVGARRIARHLPSPRLAEGGRPVVPELTEFVLDKFEADDSTFHEFAAGVHSFEMMWGDLSSKFEEFAGIAEAFRNHRLRRIREWADAEVRACRHEAEHWRRVDEEDNIP